MRKKASIIIILFSLCFLFVGCNNNYSFVSTDGSTSLERVIGALGEAFENETGTSVTYNPTGSGAGIQAVIDGRCDIGLSSRNLKGEETLKGVNGTVFAYDAIAVVLNPQNPVLDLNIKQIANIYTGKIKNWKELGGEDKDIVLIGREAGSGTRDGFEAATQTKDKCKYRQELTSTGDVITTVSGTSAAIGYASLATVKKNVKILAVNGIVPSESTVKNGSYLIVRPFLLVTKKGRELPYAAQDFLNFILSDKSNEIIAAAGVFKAQ